MKNSEIKAMNLSELKDKIASESENLRKLQFAHKVSSIENPMRLKESRRTIARLKTELKIKEIQK